MNPRIFADIKLLLLDVDGVLTTGQIIYSGDSIETKIFNVKDGLGIRMLQSAGIAVGIVTGRTSEALHTRCRDLGITMIYDGVKKKGQILNEILAATGCRSTEIAFMGDDLPDISLMRKVGVSVAVADGHDAVKNAARIITRRAGGMGAVREVCEMILDDKQLLEKMIENCH